MVGYQGEVFGKQKEKMWYRKLVVSETIEVWKWAEV